VNLAPQFPQSRWPDLPIRTRRLLLRLTEMRDVEDIRRAVSHPSTRWGLHALPRPYLQRHAVEFVKRKRSQFRKRESLALAITAGADGSLVGMIELMHPSATDRVAELGYWIAPGHRRQGYATEAARAMCEVGFRVLRLHRIEAGALARNRASIRVLEKAGLRHEGHFRERVRIGRRWLDQVRLGRVTARSRSKGRPRGTRMPIGSPTPSQKRRAP
jgi:[ribosomal protein S5]-alanine N-acetyltransferase